MSFKSVVVGVALALAMLVSSPKAEAAFIGPVSVFGETATSSFGAPLNVGDVGVIVGSVAGDATSFHHTFTFETDGGFANAAAVSIEIPALLGIDNLRLSLNGSDFQSGLLVASLIAGTNELVVRGQTIGLFGGNYKADIAITETPIPGAALLFGSAMAGLGYVRRRRAAAA